MKHNILHFCLSVAFCSFLPYASGQETNRLKKNASEPLDPRAANASVGLNQAIADLISNPDLLFFKLDTNNDGALSKEEFARIPTIGAQGAGGTTGTTGIRGATGATGTTGGTGTKDTREGGGASQGPSHPKQAPPPSNPNPSK
jgi:hypothetical protein